MSRLSLYFSSALTVTVLAVFLERTQGAREGDLQLVGGPSKYEGNVFIYHLNSWGIICDDDWSMTNAHVVCKQLGYGVAEKHTKHNRYLTYKRRIWKDNVKCTGVETKLISCPSNPWAIHNCKPKEAAGVKCRPLRGDDDVQDDAEGITENDLIPPEDREQRVSPIANLRRWNFNQFLARTNRPDNAFSTTLADLLRRRYGQSTPQSESTRTAPRSTAPTNPPSTVTNKPSTPTTVTTTPKVATTTKATTTTAPTTTTATTTTATKPTTTRKPTTTEKVTVAPPTPSPTQAATTRSTPRVSYNIININDWLRPRTFSPRPAWRMFTALDVSKELSKMADAPNTAEEYNYPLRLQGGRNANEGRVEVFVDNQWSIVCGEQWGLLDATVVCRHIGLGYGKHAVKVNHFGGELLPKAFSAIKCAGHERSLHNCIHMKTVGGNTCSKRTSVAGVVCTRRLPDLLPNVTLLMDTVRLEDRQLYHLQCAMEENCVASTAYDIRARNPGSYHGFTRRLLRFSSSVANVGTADFNPHIPKSKWEWHLCHMHYHSMDVFAHYDIYDSTGRRVAEGHKASFCLEDTECQPGVKPKYQCVNFGDQGIRVGCADTYAHDIDCQWIDISDMRPGDYKFTINVNPEYKVAEMNYDNNQISCDLGYTGFRARFENCKLGRGTSRGSYTPTADETV